MVRCLIRSIKNIDETSCNYGEPEWKTVTVEPTVIQ